MGALDNFTRLQGQGEAFYMIADWHALTSKYEAVEEIWPANAKWTHPQGGMFLWGILPSEMDTAEVLKMAIERKVAFVPGTSFHANGGGQNTMRLNFSYASPDVIREGTTRLGLLLRELVKSNGHHK